MEKIIKKMTKKENFNALLAIPAVAENAGLVEFINHEIELLDRKSISKTGERKLTPTQIENENHKVLILGVMDSTPKTVTDIMKAIPQFADYSNQKIAALVKQLVTEEKVVKSTIKGRSYFTLA